MHFKQSTSIRQITLPDGSVLRLSDLPPTSTRRWVASRKALVLKAVIHGLLTKQEVLEMYDVSAEELQLWRTAIENHGMAALKVTSIQKYRQQ